MTRRATSTTKTSHGLRWRRRMPITKCHSLASRWTTIWWVRHLRKLLLSSILALRSLMWARRTTMRSSCTLSGTARSTLRTTVKEGLISVEEATYASRTIRMSSQTDRMTISDRSQSWGLSWVRKKSLMTSIGILVSTFIVRKLVDTA